MSERTPAGPVAGAAPDTEPVAAAGPVIGPAAVSEPDAAAVRASSILEAVARDRGLRVRRLGPDLLLCASGHRAATFLGLAGPGSSHLAHVLSGNPAWLRRHLAERDLPTLASRLVDLGDEDVAVVAADALGFPVVLSLAAGGQAGVAGDADAFHAHWRRLVQAAADSRAQVVVQRKPAGPAVTVAVVGGEVVAVKPGESGDLPRGAEDLAVRAAGAVPGCGYGSVRLVTDPDSADLVIDSVDPSLSAWAGAPDSSATVASAVLAYELDRG